MPFPAPLVHAIAYDFAPADGGLAAGAIPKLRPGNAAHTADVRLGLGGPHRYVFQVFALDTTLEPFAKPPSKRTPLDAMAGHVIARGATIGLAEA